MHFPPDSAFAILCFFSKDIEFNTNVIMVHGESARATQRYHSVFQKAMILKRFPRYWLFVWGTTWLVASSQKGPIMRTCMYILTDMPDLRHLNAPMTSYDLVYMFSLYIYSVYFSVEVCLEGMFPHSVSTRQDSCVSVYAPLTLAPPSR